MPLGAAARAGDERYLVRRRVAHGHIAVSEIELVGTGGVQTVATFSPSQQINLLNYETAPLQLGTGQVSAGTYQQLRLVLDTSQADDTSVVINGVTYPLSIPSATGIGFGGNTSTDNGDGMGTSNQAGANETALGYDPSAGSSFTVPGAA